MPKYVALDTSHWKQWIEDFLSSDRGRRTAAQGFENALMDRGFTILLTMHHLIELMAHENDAETERRLRFVRSRPFLAWINKPHSNEYNLGGIADVMAAEVSAALGGRDLQRTRELARAALLRFGSAADAVPDHPLFLPVMQVFAREHADVVRTITALAPWRALPDDTPVRVLLENCMREPGEVTAAIMGMGRAIITEIERHGDKRIVDAPQRAYSFLREVLEAKAELPSTAREMVLAGYALRGIDADEIGPEATLGAMDALGEFRSKLKSVAENAGWNFDVIKRQVHPEQLPHWIVIEALKRYGQKRERRGGGDLYDHWLAGLSPYVDVVMVDRRTWEDFRQARGKVPVLATLSGRVEKASRYSLIPEILDRAETEPADGPIP